MPALRRRKLLKAKRKSSSLLIKSHARMYANDNSPVLRTKKDDKKSEDKIANSEDDAAEDDTAPASTSTKPKRTPKKKSPKAEDDGEEKEDRSAARRVVPEGVPGALAGLKFMFTGTMELDRGTMQAS